MKIILWVLVVMVMAGCNASRPVTAAPTQAENMPNTIPPLSDKQKIALLRDEAKKRGLRWFVRCASVSFHGEDSFVGIAEDKKQKEKWLNYEDEGALPSWAVIKPTESEVVYALYLAIQQPPNRQPRKRELEPKKKHCPPELNGD